MRRALSLNLWSKRTQKVKNRGNDFPIPSLDVDTAFHDTTPLISAITVMKSACTERYLRLNNAECQNVQNHNEFKASIREFEGQSIMSQIKCYAERKDLQNGVRIHKYVASHGWLGKDVSIGNALVNMYSKCASLLEAQLVFDALPFRDVVSWNVLIAAYAKSEKYENAFICYKLMQLEGVLPDAVTFVSSLNGCVNVGEVQKGLELHTQIVMKGLFEENMLVGNALVGMYAKCNRTLEAQKVFDMLPIRDVVSWNVIISGYAKSNDGSKALDCFRQMRLQGFLPNSITYVCILKGCTTVQSIEKGKEIHVEITQEGLLKGNGLVGNALVDMYAECGHLEVAHIVFDELPVHNVVSWSSLISGYVKHENSVEALYCFDQMCLNGVSPNSVTFHYALKACGNICAVDKGREMHAEIARKQSLKGDLVVSNALVEMYISCGLFQKAQELLYNLGVQDTILWTALITGYVQNGLHQQALKCFEKMQEEGISPNAVTVASILKACGRTTAVDKGSRLVADVFNNNKFRNDVVLGNVAINMYARCGLISEAKGVFNQLLSRDVISWTTLIGGCVENELPHEAITLFEQMQAEGCPPNDTTFVYTVKACGILGAMGKGKKLHSEISRKGILEDNPFVGNALINTYAKCGLLQEARDVFNSIPARDVVSWTTLITGYVQVGDSDNTFHIFDRMEVDGIQPDLISFNCILNACSHMGILDMGQFYFDSIFKYRMSPEIEHQTCMVDLFGRLGHLCKARTIAKEMKSQADVILWYKILDTCRNVGHVNFGQMAFQQINLCMICK